MLATASTPTAIDVALIQLVSRSPRALPGGTRPDAIPPTAAPSVNGTMTDDSANRRSTQRWAPSESVCARSTYAVARSTMPSAAIVSGTASVDAIAANAVG